MKKYIHNDSELAKELMDRFDLPELKCLGDIKPKDLDQMTKAYKLGVGASRLSKRMGFKCWKSAKKYIDITIQEGYMEAHKALCRGLHRNGYFTRNG